MARSASSSPTAPTPAPYYSVAPDALGSFDAEFDWADVPAVYISQQDGAWLEGQLKPDGVGPVVTMKLIENVRMATKGGTGYNVFGDLPGKVKDGTFVLFGAHHDGYFHSATDDTDGDVNNLAIAKAMVKSGYRPQHTVRFMVTTGEEFGYVNSYYDWCIGAWYSITHAHPAWAGKIRAFLNSDHFVGRQPAEDHEPRTSRRWSAAGAAAASRPAALRLQDQRDLEHLEGQLDVRGRGRADRLLRQQGRQRRHLPHAVHARQSASTGTTWRTSPSSSSGSRSRSTTAACCPTA